MFLKPQKEGARGRGAGAGVLLGAEDTEPSRLSCPGPGPSPAGHRALTRALKWKNTPHFHVFYCTSSKIL